MMRMSGDTFVIEGLSGKKLLSGTIPVYGAKNAVLPIMAAAALLEGETKLANVPGITDVGSMSRLLEDLGAFVTQTGKEMTISAKGVSGTVLNPDIAKLMRASIVLTGPILARMGQVTFPHPGGDVIGERPIDIFVSGFKKLGATYTETAESYTLSAPGGLSGGEFFFRIVSVTATETIMMAAVLAKGPVTLKNCAMEPEVIAVADFLISCGAQIEGAGTPTIRIKPSVLHVPENVCSIIPDRIEATTFLALGALAGEELQITNIEPSHLDAVLDMFSAAGVTFSITKNAITVRAPEKFNPVKLRTHEYPGFPTDGQAPMTILLTQAEGESAIYETIFDGRLRYIDELTGMGANVTVVNPHRANVKGSTPLTGRDIATPDIRAGLAFILAAAIADGKSNIGNAHLIDRGYEKIEERLSAVGLSIKRV